MTHDIQTKTTLRRDVCSVLRMRVPGSSQLQWPIFIYTAQEICKCRRKHKLLIITVITKPWQVATVMVAISYRIVSYRLTIFILDVMFLCWACVSCCSSREVVGSNQLTRRHVTCGTICLWFFVHSSSLLKGCSHYARACPYERPFSYGRPT